MKREIIIKEISPLLLKVKQLEITDNTSLTKATGYLSDLNSKLDSIIEDKEKITKPINASLKEIREKYRPIETKLKELIDLIRAKMSEYATALDAKRKAEEVKIEAKLESGKLNVMQALNKLDAIPTVPDNTVTDSGSVKFRPKNVLNITDSALIPRLYLVPNTVMLLDDLEQGKIIPGCEIKVIQIVYNSR